MKLLEKFGNSSKVFSRCFYDFLKVLENLRKVSENFGNGSKVIFRCFYDFLKIFGKSSEIFVSVWKSLETISGCDRKCS